MSQRKAIYNKILNQKQGFTLVELAIVVAILAILSAIAIPWYNGHIDRAERAAARAVISSIPTLIVTYQADNDLMCPACNVDSPAGSPYTYTYSEDAAGVEVDNGVNKDITDIYPNFRAKGISQTGPSNYHYKIEITVVGGVQTATVTATPQTTLGAPSGDIVSAPFN
jgi:prepilin-type N-terminal cleavage/methylation domain-containing protein